MVKANVDKILDVLNQKNSVSISELSKTLKLKKEDIQKSAEYLEQDGVIKIEHKWPKVILTLTQQNKKQPMLAPPLNQQLQPIAQQKPAQPPTQPMSQNQVKQPMPASSLNSSIPTQQNVQKPIQTPAQPQQIQGISKPPLNQQKPVQQPQNVQQQTALQSQSNLKPITPPLNNSFNQNIQQSQLLQQPKKAEINTFMQQHPNLPPPPVPKQKASQKTQINYTNQSSPNLFIQKNQGSDISTNQ